jgi:tetratricopeptide (TPR) repeat protein
MANDEKTTPPKTQTAPPPRLGTAQPEYPESNDWEREVAAWDPSFSPGTPPPVALTVEPPSPDSAELIVDDVNSGEIILSPPSMRRPEAPVELTPTPEPSAGPGFQDPYGDEGEPTLVAAAPGAAPQSAYPDDQESSGVVVIPEVSELEAAASAPLPGMTSEEPDLPQPVNRAPTPPAPSPPREIGRDLTADGLPDVSALFFGGAAAAPLPTAPPAAGTAAFEEPLPEETPVLTLDLSFPTRTSRPLQEIADAAAAFSGDGTLLDERAELEQQLTLYTEQLGALQAAATATAEARLAVCRTALAAARAAERLGNGQAAGFYDQALALDAGYAPALRGRLRLLIQTGALAEARAAAAELARVAPAERAAYELILEHTRPPDDSAAEPSAPETGSVGRLLLDCERALARDARPAAAASVEKLADLLPGDLQPALRAFAAVLFESVGDAPAAARLRGLLGEADAARTGFASLRAALRLPDGEALEAVVGTVEALPVSPLGVSLLRWAVRLAHQQGQPGRAHALLERAHAQAQATGTTLPPLDAVEALNLWPESAPVDALLDRLDRVDPDSAALAARRMGLRLIADGRPADALSALRRVRGRSPTVEPAVLGLVAEQAAYCAAERDDRAQALLLWGELDPARMYSATTLRAHTLLRNDRTRAEGLAALEQAARADGRGALYWWLSWYLRREGRSARAAEALLSAAACWSAPSIERVAAALRERAQELDLAAHPENLVAYLPRGPMLPPTADDPARLVRELLAPESDPAAIAEAFQQAATEGSRLRVLEAAGWFVQAGAYDQAMTWVRGAIPQASSQPITNVFLRRVVGMVEDPLVQAAVLGELAAANAGADDLRELEFRRAEALERAGQREEAVTAYRELLSGALSRDADLSLRRVLWALRDADGLDTLWRHEYDGHSNAGRVRAAAAALVERARIARDLRGDTAEAQAELSAARLLDADRAEARVMLLSLPASRPTAPELVILLEELAREMPAEAVSIQFLSALIADGQGHPETAQRLLREALRRAGERPSLALVRRHVTSEENRQPPAPDLALLLEARAQSIATTPGADPRLGTSLFTRAAEVEEAAGRRERAEHLYRRALANEPDHLPALIRLRKLLVARGAHAEAVDVLEAEARAVRRPVRRGQALFQAAIIATDRLGDPTRARALLERTVEADPRNDQAFTRLRKLLEEAGELEAVTELLGRRLAGASPEAVTALRLERVDLMLGRLGDRAAAKRELHALLENEPDNAGILGRLAAMELEDGDPGTAAELSIRQARFERDPAALEACFLRIGRLYLRRLNDPRVALGAYERVLRIAPGSREALEALSELYARQNDNRKALAVTERLVEQETDPGKRMPFLIRLGVLWEAAGDPRRAGVMLRRAVDESPRSLQSIGELARFHERNKEPQARNVLLEGALSLLASDLRSNPDNLDTLRTMIPILRWRQRRTGATSAAQLLARFTPDGAERRDALAWTEAPGAGRRLAPLANPELDERALPRRVQGGIRHVLRLLGPALAHANRPDLRRWQVGRSARQRVGSETRHDFETVAADLGIRNFELYVSDTDPRALAVEPAEPPVIVIGSGLVKQGRSAVRFAAGWCLRLVETHFDLLLEHSPMEAAALLAGVVRRFLPEYDYPDLEEGALVAAEARVSRALGKGRRSELAPFANEIAGAFSPNGLFLDAQETAARAGLLACGDLAAALDLIATAAGRPTSLLSEMLEIPVAGRLVDFALAEDHEELASALESVG